ncbi:MAG TPA: ribbon-helix-helix protein, CopG family [Blastocatellia bacterium]|nr:ribbon-helix-helix protein, CopG family [Blastocatellia bacterium]
MKQKKDVLWNFRANDNLIERLNRASIATDRPAAQIVREAIREKLDQLAAEFPQIDAAPAQQAPAAS